MVAGPSVPFCLPSESVRARPDARECVVAQLERALFGVTEKLALLCTITRLVPLSRISRNPPGELPVGEDCVFRRPPVVIIMTTLKVSFGSALCSKARARE